MLKKWIAVMLSLMIIVSALPIGALATEATVAPETTQATEVTAPADKPQEETVPTAEPEKLEITATEVPAWGKSTPPQKLRTKAAKIQLLRDAIVWDFQNAQAQEGKQSLFGYCGVLASYQMFFRGINNWRKSTDGNLHFEEYGSMSMTTGGYVPQAYAAVEATQEQPKVEGQAAPASKTLKQVLDEITNHGTHDVYNLLVCFERTTTQAGSIYGHVVFVYGIIDGVLYFTEGASGFDAEPGQPMECNISTFAEAYDTWAEFEGIVVLGCKDYLDNCAVFQSDMFAACITATELTTLPCWEEETQWRRSVQKGERLHVIGLYQNREGQYYYQIDDGGEIGYVPAQTLRPILYLHDEFTLEDIKLPETLQTGKDFVIDGTLLSPGVLLSRVGVQILDEEGNILQEVEQATAGESYDLGNYSLNGKLNFGALEEGTYTFRIQADSKISVVGGESVVDRVHTETLLEQTFCVQAEAKQEPVQEVPVESQPAEPVAAEPVEESPKNGWHYENQTWYCYKDSQPRTGWVRSAGITYYLKEDGSVTTGKAEVEGQQRVFSATGALIAGWYREQDGMRYLDGNSQPLCGWQKINGVIYFFNNEGLLRNKYAGSAQRQVRQTGLTVDGHKENPTAGK